MFYRSNGMSSGVKESDQQLVFSPVFFIARPFFSWSVIFHTCLSPLFLSHCNSQVATIFTFPSDCCVTAIFRKRYTARLLPTISFTKVFQNYYRKSLTVPKTNPITVIRISMFCRTTYYISLTFRLIF